MDRTPLLNVIVSEVVLVVKNQPANVGDKRDVGSIPRVFIHVYYFAW